MSSVSNLRAEFEKVKKGNNPDISLDIDAVVVLSGESAGSSPGIYESDTEERVTFAVSIYREIEKLGGFPQLVLNGTKFQNKAIKKIAELSGVKNIMFIENPPFPKASTDTQIQGLAKLNFKKIAIVTHAYHGPRARITVLKWLPKKVFFDLFLLDRKNMKADDIEREIEKIKRYFYD